MIEPRLRRADATDRELLERLWVMYSAAAAFWRHAAASISDTWTEERRPIPGHEDLAEDSWISFIA